MAVPHRSSAPRPTATPHAAADPAALARSVLACPAGAALAVDGLADPLVGVGPDGLAVHDLDGRPTFACPVDAPLAAAARSGAGALVTLESGLGAPGSPERDVVVSLGGVLRSVGRRGCSCCRERREVIELDLDLVVVTGTAGAPGVHVSSAAFAAVEHRLNCGVRQRLAEHLNDGHGDALRRAVAGLTGTSDDTVAAAQVAVLEADHLVLRWVDRDGAHSGRCPFVGTAATAVELGEQVRRVLRVDV